jgi:hypothetical protein
MRETTVEAHLIATAKSMGGLAVKHVSPGRAGDPDRLVAIPQPRCPCCGLTARVGLMELKAPGKVVRPLQAHQIMEWQRVGVLAGWADSKPAVDLVLQSWGVR